MSTFVPNTTNLPKVKDANVAILASSWHEKFVESMVHACETVLQKQGANIQKHVVPGTYEFPIAAQALATTDLELEAIVCLSVLLKGDTQHFEMILNACSTGLTHVSLDLSIIIVNGILPANTIEEVFARTKSNDQNKGFEVGIATVRMIDWERSILER
ncbi:MAG: 6,7-dimethyl-8-ribityllumazine synthase [Gammaproteobacteria bacterium]|nr:6,7-dimethyl-8-ribityllumazine synthase [Gammaproteobacteria bacterium]MDE0252553.1 6,7-dimethyl-8-ribityllumazine synthase [Gammaproteobacteria bacterium]MDE0402963.1 6,7-dimethyl-8-ribityllumazine synthase [Gammaproteobacteria bacterium]